MSNSSCKCDSLGSDAGQEKEKMCPVILVCNAGWILICTRRVSAAYLGLPITVKVIWKYHAWMTVFQGKKTKKKKLSSPRSATVLSTITLPSPLSQNTLLQLKKKKAKKNFLNFSAAGRASEMEEEGLEGLTSTMFLQTEWLGSLLPWQQTTWLGVLDCLRQGAARHGVSVPLCAFQNLVLVSLLKVCVCV